MLWAFAYVSVGSLAAGSYRELSDRLHSAGYVFVGIIAAFLLAAFIVKKILSRSEARHMERAGDGDANTVEQPSTPPTAAPQTPAQNSTVPNNKA